MQEWSDALVELGIQRHRVEHPERAGNIEDVDVWTPRIGDNIDPVQNATAALTSLLRNDVDRHVRPVKRSASEQEQAIGEEFEATAMSGGKTMRVYVR